MFHGRGTLISSGFALVSPNLHRGTCNQSFTGIDKQLYCIDRLTLKDRISEFKQYIIDEKLSQANIDVDVSDKLDGMACINHPLSIMTVANKNCNHEE